MGISLKPEHLKRYRDIAWLFMKYGRSDLVKQSGLEEVLDEESSVATHTSAPEAEELASDLEKMGPTFIKLAQLLSTRALPGSPRAASGQRRTVLLRRGRADHTGRTGRAYLEGFP
jgi:hypothetical protein